MFFDWSNSTESAKIMSVRVCEGNAGGGIADFRSVAPVIAIERVVHATLMRGIWQ